MRRSISFIFALLLFNIPVLAQTDTTTLPFFYAYWFGTEDLDFHVMDALSGETLHSFESVEKDCPISLSADGEWLVYSQNSEVNYLENLSTGEVFEFDEGYLAEVLWNSENQLLALHYNTNLDEHGLQVYDLGNNEQILNTMVYSENISSFTVKFDGSDLLYAYLSYYATAIEVHRLIVDYDEALYFPIDSYEDWWALRFSPNGRYLLGAGTDYGVNLMDLADGTVSDLGEVPGGNAVLWMPNEDATIAYFTYDETDTIQLANYAIDSEEPEGIDGESVQYVSLSSDGSFAAYSLQPEDGEFVYGIINSDNGEMYIFESGFYEFTWISGSQAVYTSFNTENESIDLYFYDAITGENRQLTDTAELYEQLNCAMG